MPDATQPCCPQLGTFLDHSLCTITTAALRTAFLRLSPHLVPGPDTHQCPPEPSAHPEHDRMHWSAYPPPQERPWIGLGLPKQPPQALPMNLPPPLLSSPPDTTCGLHSWSALVRASQVCFCYLALRVRTQKLWRSETAKPGSASP